MACMTRPKAYDRAEVLRKATEVFWELGFAGTSIQDLVDATGVHRRSMYEEFGGKNGLFLACVNHFVDREGAEIYSCLRREPLGLENIRAFFRGRAKYASQADCKGCMIVNSAIELELLSAAVRERVKEIAVGSEEPFHANLLAARKRGELDAGADCRGLARYLFTLQQGLMVACKTAPKRRAVDAIIKHGLSVLPAGTTVSRQ
jgi:TetR/AcrR family transcriptional repressor of nem operon